MAHTKCFGMKGRWNILRWVLGDPFLNFICLWWSKYTPSKPSQSIRSVSALELIFQCFHCCNCTSGHWAKNLGTWNFWKPGSRVEDWIVDEEKRVRVVFVCLVILYVVGTCGLSHKTALEHCSSQFVPHCTLSTVLFLFFLESWKT